MSASKGKQLSRKLGLILFGLLTGLIVGEISVRLAGYSFPEFYKVDSVRGFSLRPGIEGWYRKEGESYVRINSDGLRDREHQRAKPPNTFRIAVVGDSYAEALQVPMEQSFWWLMGEKLQSCINQDRKVEVINFGVSGYGTAQELITLRQTVWQFEPDLILLAFTTSNDISDNSRVLKNPPAVPYFSYRDNQLVLDDSFTRRSAFQWKQTSQSGIGQWIRDHSRLVQAVMGASRSVRLTLAARREKQTSGEQQTTSQPAQELGVDNAVYVEPNTEDWKDAWKVTEGLITTMRNEVAARGVDFIVVTLSNGIQVTPNAETRAAFMKQVGSKDMFYPDHRINALGDREGFTVINLAPEMAEYAERNGVYLHGFDQEVGSGHWNANGHRLAAELLTQKLWANGLVK